MASSLELDTFAGQLAHELRTPLGQIETIPRAAVRSRGRSLAACACAAARRRWLC